MTATRLTRRDPLAVLEEARDHVAEGRAEAWDLLDRELRWHLVRFLQDRAGEADALRRALVEASDWARREEREPWDRLWPYLLELLRDAERSPAVAAELRALAAADAPRGRAATVLRLLAASPVPMRPVGISDATDLGPAHVSNILGKLEGADLIVRRSLGGRAVAVFATPRGHRIAALLPLEPRPASREKHVSAAGDVRPLSVWSPEALEQPVEGLH